MAGKFNEGFGPMWLGDYIALNDHIQHEQASYEEEELSIEWFDVEEINEAEWNDPPPPRREPPRRVTIIAGRNRTMITGGILILSAVALAAYLQRRLTPRAAPPPTTLARLSRAEAAIVVALVKEARQ